MSKKVLHITFTIIKNHFRLLKNWLLFKENKIILLFLFIFILLILPYSSVYFGKQTSINSQMLSILITLFFPIFITSKYLAFITREDSLLIIMFDKKNLFASKQLLLAVITLSIFLLILSLGIIPQLWKIPIMLIIILEVLIFLVFSFLLPYFTLKMNFKFKISKSTRFWDSHISNIKLLPIRGILLREFLSLLRENKKSIYRIIFNISLFNIILIFFIINNNKTNFFVWAIVLQTFLFLTLIFNYSTSNNIKLMEAMPCIEFYILKGEFVFWLILFLIYLIFIVLIYSILLFEIVFLPIITSIILFCVLLCCVLFIRLTYADNELTRTLIYLIMFSIPITIPFYIYNSYRRLKC